MKKRLLKKQEIITKLVDDDMDSLFRGPSHQEAEAFMCDILVNGYKGYDSYPTHELRSMLVGRGIDDFVEV